MAGSGLGWEILVGGDLTPLKSAIADVEKTLDKLGDTAVSEVKAVEQAAQKAAQGVGKLGPEATDALSKTGVAADRLAGAVLGADGRVRDAKGRFIALGAEGEAALKKLTGQAEQAGRAIADVPTQGLSGFGRLRQGLLQTEASLTAFQAKHQQAIANVGVVGIAAGAVFAGLALEVGAAATAFGDFEGTLNQIQAVADVTAGDMEKMRAQALQLGADTKFSAKEAADGMAELSKAGFEANETMSAIPGVMALASAGGVSVADAAELAGGAIRGFNLAASDAGRVADLMAQAANKSAVDIKDLQLTMKYVAPVASSAGQSIEEMSTAIAIMGNNMIKGEVAGTTMRSALVRLLDPPKEAAEQIAKLGLALADTKGKMLPLSDIVSQLREKTAKMSDMQRSAALSAIFGTDALSGMMALVKEAPASYDAMGASMKSIDGVSQQMAETMNKGLLGALEQATGSIDTLQITIGEQLAPAIVVAAKGVQELAGFFMGMDPATKMLIAGLGAGTLALTGITAAAGALGLALPLVTAGVGVLGLTIGTALPWVGALSLAVGVATVAAKGYADALDAETKRQQEANKQTKEASEKAITHKTALEKLVQEHDNLASKANRSKEEEKRLHEILGQVRDLSPDLAAELNKVNTSHWGSVDAVNAYIGTLDGAIAKQRKVLEGQIAIAQLAYDKKRLGVDTEAKATEKKRATTLSNGRVVPDLSRADVPLSASIPKPSEFKDMLGEVSALGQSEEAKQLAAAQKALEGFNKRAAGIVDPGPKRGKAFTADGKAKKGPKGKDPAKEAARQLKEWQRNALGAMEAKYGEAMLLNEDGDVGEAEIKRTYIVDLRMSGLDRTEAGFKKVRELSVLLKKHEASADKDREAGAAALADSLRGIEAKLLADKFAKRKAGEQTLGTMEKAMRDERAAAAQQAELEGMGYFERQEAAAKAAFTAERREAEATYQAREAQLRAIAATGINTEDELAAAQKTRDDVKKGIDAREKKAAQELANEWVKTMADMGSALMSLAQAPSWDKLADLAQNLVSDPEKVKKWGDALKGAVEGFKKGAADGDFVKGLTEGLAKAAMSGDELQLILVGVGLAIKGIGMAWEWVDEQFNGRKAMRQTLDDLWKSVKALDLKHEIGLVSQLDLAKAKAESLKSQIDSLLGQWANEEDAHQRAIYKTRYTDLNRQLGEQNNLVRQLQTNYVALGDTAEDYAKRAASALARINDQVATGYLKEELADINRIQALTAALTEMGEAQRKAFDAGDYLGAEALASARADIEQQIQEIEGRASKALKDVLKELEAGGRDSWGNRISLEGERDLKIQEAMASLEEKKTAALKQQKKLTEDIVKLNEDERKAIADIENEGIAVRAKSESQDKAERIAKVKDEAKAKRDAKTDEINGIADQVKAEEEATAKAVSNIRILAGERIKQLTDERAQLELITKEFQRQLDIQRQMSAKASASAAPGGGSYSSSYNSSTTNFDNVVQKPGQTAWYTDTQGVVHYHAEGGTPVPPSGERPGLFKPGEFVLTPPQMNNLLTAASANAMGFQAMADVFKRGALVSPSYAHMAQAASVSRSTNVNLGGITVHAAPGMNERQLVNLMRQTLAQDLRRSGFGR